MTDRRIAATTALLLLCGCGPKSLALPAQPIDRAATCGAIAASEARLATPDIQAPLSFDAMGHILHYTLLGGSEDGRFSSEAAAAVSKRMSEIQGEIAEGKWQELIPACRAAFPQAEVKEATLPSDRFEAQLGCDELGDFMMAALKAQDSEYGNELAEYRQLSYKFDQQLGPGLRSRVGSDLAAQQEARRKALAEIAEAGPPVTVMRQCLKRFG